MYVVDIYCPFFGEIRGKGGGGGKGGDDIGVQDGGRGGEGNAAGEGGGGW